MLSERKSQPSPCGEIWSISIPWCLPTASSAASTHNTVEDSWTASPLLGPHTFPPSKVHPEEFSCGSLKAASLQWHWGLGANCHTECLASFVEFKVIPEFVSDLGVELASSLVNSIHRWWLSAKWEHSQLASCCFNLNTNHKLLKQRPPLFKT